MSNDLQSTPEPCEFAFTIPIDANTSPEDTHRIGSCDDHVVRCCSAEDFEVDGTSPDAGDEPTAG